VDRCFLALDVGGTKLAAGIVDARGRVLVRDRVATPARDVWPALSRLALRVQAAAPNPPAGCGIGCAGPVDPRLGTVSPLHIPSLHDFALRSEVESLTQLPTVLDTEGKALVLGEAWCGAAEGRTDFVAVVMGTAVGGAVMSEGRVLGGQHGNAGSIGHLVVEPDGRPCTCGGQGCLDAYCGGRAIELETGRPPQRSPQSIIDRTGMLVGRAVSSIAALCDLRLAVVGGSLALGFGAPFFDAAQAEATQRARLPFTQGLTVVPAGLGSSAPLVGAAALMRAHID
jgi:glucokinase